MGIIYILENKINGKYYIGQTIRSFKERFRQHQISHSIIGNALRKYGTDSFNKIIIEDISEEKLDELEQVYIQKYNSIYPNGYNFDGGGHKNKHLHEDHKKKLREARKGKKPFLGKHCSEEHKRKIGESKKGNSYALGRKHTKEELKKMSESKKGFHHSEETKKKLSESHKRPRPWMIGKHFKKTKKKNLTKTEISGKLE